MGRTLIVGLMLFLWLGTVALAASPQLHHRLHKDSQSVTHECIVTLFSKSYLLSGSASASAPAVLPIFWALLLLVECSRVSIIDFRLSPSRAPPSALSAIKVVG